MNKNYLQKIIKKEKDYHQKFFGKSFNLDKFAKDLEDYSDSKIKLWESWGFEPHFFPEVKMLRSTKFPGWNAKPEEKFYIELIKGNIFHQVNGKYIKDYSADTLEGVSVLIDVEIKPLFKLTNTWGKQTVFSKDKGKLGKVIESLRRQKKIRFYSKFTEIDSRFGLSPAEFDKYIAPELSKALGVKGVRMERFIEANVIPQLYTDIPRAEDSYGFNVIIHADAYLSKAHHLITGSFEKGSPKYFDFVFWPDFWYYRAPRIVAIL